jgi:hypothetical protein
MIDGLTVTIPLALAIELRDALLRARDNRQTLDAIQRALGSVEVAGRQSDDVTLLQLRRAMGEAEHDVPIAPRRGDTIRRMRAVRIDE